ncbi:MAG: fatty acid--CoA ligase family protein, partial [Chloroflexota bacterium]|nr:fatty acid--CoA ligase family protein [Chloroflexota bacterium]
IDSVGKPVWGSAIRIVNEADRDVPVGEEGELALKGEFIAQGYWKNPELTEKEFRDGWWYSGDLATMDKDGYVYIAGRKDDMIKSGGLKVHRTEVEGVILKHQAIREVAVFGLPDPKWGQSITAVVSCKEGHQASEDDLKGHCRESLAGFQVPKTIYFMKDLPKDPSGNKVLVKELKKLYSGQVM